jgi:predicted TPR repeat methyltransferase
MSNATEVGRRNSAALRIARRFLVDPFDRQLERELEREIVGSCRSLLDLGCGHSSPIRHFSGRLPRAVGVDLFEPYLQRSVAAGIHSEYRCMNVLEAGENFAPGEFDCVVALDLIEHLPREQGVRLLEMMERIAAKKVVVFTPNGFVPQEAYDDNPFQRHLSGWTVEEMQSRGYRVIGLYGWKPIRGERGEPRWRPRRFWDQIALFTQPLVRSRPEQAFHLMCIRDVPAVGDATATVAREASS